jgi:hypothetical protein
LLARDDGERIASSPIGDRKLNRRWIGIDITDLAIAPDSKPLISTFAGKTDYVVGW